MRLPSTSTCDPFRMFSATKVASFVRKMEIRCHSVFDTHSSSEFFQERWVATDSTVNLEPLLRDCRSSGSEPTNPTNVTLFKYIKRITSFSAPVSWGTTESEGAGSRRLAAAFWGGPGGVEGGAE